MLSVGVGGWGQGTDRDIQSFSGWQEGQEWRGKKKKRKIGGVSYCSQKKIPRSSLWPSKFLMMADIWSDGRCRNPLIHSLLWTTAWYKGLSGRQLAATTTTLNTEISGERPRRRHRFFLFFPPKMIIPLSTCHMLSTAYFFPSAAETAATRHEGRQGGVRLWWSSEQERKRNVWKQNSAGHPSLVFWSKQLWF